MTDVMVRRLAHVLIIVCGVVFAIPVERNTLQHTAAQAPAPNLLVNGELESPYYGQPGAPTRSVPNGWTLWINRGDPDSLPHSAAPQSRDGSVTWLLGSNNETFMAAGYQRIEGLSVGDVLHLTAAGWLYTCDNPVTRCVIPGTGTPRSNPAAVAALQVGIDPTGGTNPLSTNVRWSAPASPYDRWYTLSVTIAAESDAATVFLYMTQVSPMALNDAYWDHASLVRVTGEDAALEPALPVTLPQGPQTDGGLIHIVQAGDTVDRIAAAYAQYGVTVDGIAAANGLNPAAPGLLLGQNLVLLPPGSVDPVSGWLLVDGATVTPTAASSATQTLLPTATETSVPTDTPVPTATDTLVPTATDIPTDTPVPTATETAIPPSETPPPTATETLAPTLTPLPTATMTPIPPSDTPLPTDTASPAPVAVVTDIPAATAAPTEVPTDIPTATATDVPPPTALPSETPTEIVPPTVPPAVPTVPVTDVAVASAGDLLLTGDVCVTLFDDRDTDGVQDLSERALVGSTITLRNAGGEQVLPVESEVGPVCFTLSPGSYALDAAPVDGYALTSATPLQVALVGGQRLRVRLGASAGYAPPAPSGNVAAPTVVPDASGSAAPFYGYAKDEPGEDDTIFDRIYGISGWILLILAVALVFGGNWVWGLLRDRE